MFSWGSSWFSRRKGLHSTRINFRKSCLVWRLEVVLKSNLNVTIYFFYIWGFLNHRDHCIHVKNTISMAWTGMKDWPLTIVLPSTKQLKLKRTLSKNLISQHSLFGWSWRFCRSPFSLRLTSDRTSWNSNLLQTDKSLISTLHQLDSSLELLYCHQLCNISMNLFRQILIISNCIF